MGLSYFISFVFCFFIVITIVRVPPLSLCGYEGWATCGQNSLLQKSLLTPNYCISEEVKYKVILTSLIRNQDIFRCSRMININSRKIKSILLATHQTDVSTSVIQIPATPTPTTTPIIPNRREIRDWVTVDRQIGSFYEVQNCFICVSQHKCIAIYLFSH